MGAAYRLRRDDIADVTVLEQRDAFGGNAGSFEMGGQRLDYGSHRLHPAADAEVLDDIRELLGDDLVKRPRHGRILLRGRWIHFPLKPADLLLHAEPRFVFETLRDVAARPFQRRREEADASFESVLRSKLGPTICDSFYFPYARKIWGREPGELSAVQARRRVSANSFAKLAAKVLAQLPGIKRPDTGVFYYPKKGYGQISEAYGEEARRRGASIHFHSKVVKLARGIGADEPWTIETDEDGRTRTLHADYVWSTIPVSLLATLMEPAPPVEVQAASGALSYRAMLLIYLQLPIDRFTEYDAHYFPDAQISITRLSEPKNYVGTPLPEGRTTLCAELPCSPDDAVWSMSDDELAQIVARDLASAGLPIQAPPSAVEVKRLRRAYPIYATGYEKHFEVLDDWVTRLPRLLSYGRQGLFAHDNTHHALYMAYAAANCLRSGEFDLEQWQSYRRIFETHVVED